MSESMRDDEMTPFERYALGIPLNEELAALKDGRDPINLAPAAVKDGSLRDFNYVPLGDTDVERDLTWSERVELKELRLSRGWPILLRLLEKSSHRLEKSAITASKGDPLGRNPATGERWMERNMFEMAVKALPKLVAREIEALDGPARQDEVQQ